MATLANPDVKVTTAPNPTQGASSPPKTTPANTVPVNPTSTGGTQRQSEVVPISRMNEVTELNKRVLQENANLREDIEMLKQRSVKQNPPNNLHTNLEAAPNKDIDPLGYLTAKVENMEQALAQQASRAKVNDGERLLSKIKGDYPIFADAQIGEDALDVLHAKLSSPDVTQGVKSPARVIREVAERFSQFKVSANNSVPIIKEANAEATNSLSGGTHEVGGLKPEAVKFKSFDEANKAAKGRWNQLVEKAKGQLQI